jgi:cysteine desulfurase
LASLYFDFNATAPPRPEAVEAAARVEREAFGNPSSQHSRGRRARALLEESRESLAATLGVAGAEIAFTSGGTEANRLAIQGALGAAGGRGPRGGGGKLHAVASAIEHPSVLGVYRSLGEAGEAEVALAGAREDGRIVLEEIAARLRPETAIVSLQLANNETGAIQPVRELAAMLAAREGVRRPILHVDAVQALGKIPVRPLDLGADIVTVSSHKVGGPKGCGAVWIRRGAPFLSPDRGGPQERGLRPGTENLPAAVGFALAAEVAAREVSERTPPAFGARLRLLLSRSIEGVAFNGGPEHVLHNTVNASFAGVPSEILVIRLDQEGVAASTGSACASGSREPSHVLAAMGLPPARVASAVRFSAGWSTREEDVVALVDAIARAVAEIRRLQPAGR